jgi:tetratricopeptide (TPR) repeat protein
MNGGGIVALTTSETPRLYRLSIVHCATEATAAHSPASFHSSPFTLHPFFALFIALFLLLLGASGCATAGPPTVPNEREWTLLQADYQWLETLRRSAPILPPTASRKEQIEALLEVDRKVEPTLVAFLDKVRAYYDRTHDARASKLYADEKVAIADQYANVLSRYDRAIDLYNAALLVDPSNAVAHQHLDAAVARRFVSVSAFANVRSGMKEQDVRDLVGLPREDWIKQVVQSNRVYSVWIYPKQDGGASAIYFDNGLVYHTNWNAAAPTASAAAGQ